jgi:hypothetical protein
MPIATLRLALWLFLALAVGAAGTMAYRWVYDRGAQSRQSEFDRLKLQSLTLTAVNETANAEALRRGQEAAQAARAIEDEQRRRIEEAEALYASYEAAAAIAADERERRLRSALDARSCRANSVRRARVPEAADVESRPAETAGVVVDTLAGDLRAFGDGVDRLAGQYAVCYAAVRAGREVSR